MRKIVLSMVMSLDGFVAGEDGDSSWHVMDEEMHDFMDDFLDSVDTLLYGRVAYEMMLQHWPSAEFDKKSTEKNRSFARKMNKMKKVVFSRTLEKVEWNARLVKGNLAFEVEKLKDQPGKKIALLAGASIAQTFIQHDLIDEYRLILNPVLIGKGQRLFNDVNQKLELIESRTFQCGNVLLVYK
ncbi:pyrimidine reductase [Oceanobacillus oncorhynchi subsp. incaldanensis]|uniref:Dihydrofolate reductase family protein n=2 Tax=Oceanobacillus TaxID=182709 RepID=A0ABV9JXM4_9BACI|nr:dihydrofolate reductase family protein [Oceanobacillus oncorhynchi]MDM8101720.1 dihydrofolate reductase family protein [Oceanobacillus oncorhynchi]UUI41276.1 dihydrofolate reductase family protein [Oceanobacillus oncorhynchi]GIO19370.1 pyrimidine reductase [Oceanobacillus oncorhynchi subsp. incaldanensis]